MSVGDLRGQVVSVAASLSLIILFVCEPCVKAADPRSAPGNRAAVELEGEFEVIHVDGYKFSRYLYFLRTGKRQIPLHFSKNPPTKLLTGAKVRVRGTQQPDGSLILASGGRNSVTTTTTSSTSSTTPLPNTLGAQPTLIILVNFQDDPAQPYTVADAQD